MIIPRNTNGTIGFKMRWKNGRTYYISSDSSEVFSRADRPKRRPQIRARITIEQARENRLGVNGLGLRT